MTYCYVLIIPASVILFLLFNTIVNVSDPVSTLSAIDQKYFNKSFIKTDFSNNNTFDIRELSRHIDRAWYAYNFKKIKLIKTGMNIVNDNDNFSLTVCNEVISCRLMGHVIYINDIKHNCNHIIDYARHHHEDVIYMEVVCTGKKYKFHDLSQVELYFDVRRSIPK